MARKADPKAESKPRKSRIPANSNPGRPAKKVYINVLVREATRKQMNVMTRRHGITQGELLDRLVAGKDPAG